MAYIGKSPVIGNFVKLDAITAVNGQAAYTMQNGGSNFTDYESVNQFLVSLNGTIQAPTDSFTVSGSTLTFASNLSTGDVIDFIMVFGNSLSAGTPTDATVSTAKIVDNAVTTAKINANAVTSAKLNNDIISGATELASEPADTDEFLVSDAGTLKRIDYSLIKGGGRNTLLATQTISSGVSHFDMTDVMTDAHNNYLLVFQGMRVSTDGEDIRVTFFTGSGTGGHVAGGSDYKFAYSEIRTDGTMSTSYDTGTSFYRPNKSGIGNASNETANGQLQFFDMRGTKKRLLYGEVHYSDANNNFVSCRSVGGSDFGDAACTGLRFEVASGNITAGTFKLYGQE